MKNLGRYGFPYRPYFLACGRDEKATFTFVGVGKADFTIVSLQYLCLLLLFFLPEGAKIEEKVDDAARLR